MTLNKGKSLHNNKPMPLIQPRVGERSENKGVRQRKGVEKRKKYSPSWIVGILKTKTISML